MAVEHLSYEEAVEIVRTFMFPVDIKDIIEALILIHQVPYPKSFEMKLKKIFNTCITYGLVYKDAEGRYHKVENVAVPAAEATAASIVTATPASIVASGGSVFELITTSVAEACAAALAASVSSPIDAAIAQFFAESNAATFLASNADASDPAN